MSTSLHIREGVPLSDHTSFGIGGPADLFAEARTADQLCRLLREADARRLDKLVLGGGTNLLVSDDGFRGMAILLRLDGFDVDERHARITVGAGVRTAHLVAETVALGLEGLTFAAGLPGTIGGGLAGNAGCFGACLSDTLVSATLISPDGELRTVDDTRWFDFAYRHSRLLTSGHIIAEATFQLERGDPSALRREADGNISLRRSKHPGKGIRTAGSYFKNLPPKTPGGRREAAGKLLDEVDAKSLSVGGAAVFEKHANIIVNKGNATAAEVLTLAEMMKRLVEERFGVRLEPEVRFVGRRPARL